MPTLVDILKYQLVLDDSQFKATAAQADAQANQLAGSIGGKLTTAVGLLAGAFTALKIGDFLKDATLTAARTEVLGTVLNVVGTNAGKSKGQIALLEEEVKALGVTTQASRESIIKFIQSGLPLEKLTKLARTAQDSAIIAETNTAEALDRLVRGIQTQQIELLRSAGVFVSIEQELNKFAKTAGRTVETLTPLEKQTIILNAVLEQGAKLTGNYTSAMEDAGKKLTSLPRFFEETSNAIGVFFIPTLNEIVDLIADVNIGITGLLTNDAIQKARDVIKSGGDFATRQKTINDLLAEQSRLQNQIAQNEFLIGEASSARALIATSGLSKLIGLGLEGGTEKLKRDLEDIKRIIEAISEIDKPFDLGSIQRDLALKKREADSLAAARKIEDREKRHAEKIAELAKTPTIGGDIAEGIDKQWEIAKAQILAEPIEVEVDFKFPTAQQQQIQEQIEKIWKSHAPAPSSEPMFDILGIQDLIKQQRDAADQLRLEYAQAFYDVKNIGSQAFSDMFGESNRLFDSIAGGLTSFFSGDAAGFASSLTSLVSSIGELFGVVQSSNDKLVNSQTDLIKAIRDWIGGARGLTEGEIEQQIKSLEELRRRIIANPDIDRKWIQEQANALGVPINLFGDIVGQLSQRIDDLNGISDRFAAGLTANTAGAREDIVGRATTAREAFDWIDFFTREFDLSLEEQQKLWEEVLDRFKGLKELSQNDIEFIRGRIDSIEGATGPTQTERSIARVSERQADSLISGLATLDNHLREGFQAVVDALTGFAANALDHLGNATIGTQINIASVSLEGADAAAVETILVKNMSNANRAAGNTRLA